ncbi:MAG: 4a-hydroxytetrahydrobiopterin dehydratase [Planctomycetaceae bacterium]|jgi:4a-hydroxytetrahydrobiopterin dehydratase|nr:4a-hydroxytetrahydrobiopterin dehydratase [Planctomycetaceae bacterium]
MEIQSAEQLVQDQCRPTAGQSGLYSEEQTLAQLACLEDWYLVAGGQKIRRDYTVKNFLAGLEFFDKVAILAEVENHHPDLHLVGYRNLSLELWTHTIGGLSVNDFILAAKINGLEKPTGVVVE